MTRDERDIAPPELERHELEALSREMQQAQGAVVRAMTLVLETELEHPQREMLSQAHRTGQKLLSNIDALVGLLEPVASSTSTRPMAACELRALIATLFAERASLAEALGLVLSSDVSPEVAARLDIDGDALATILRGLLDSSIEQAERGEVRLWAERDVERAQLRLVITSTRVIVPPSDWHLNAQSQRARRDHEGAGGIISRAFIQKLGGRMRDEVSVAALRTITVEIPENLQPHRPEQLESREVEDSPRRRVGRVLVAERNAIHASWLRRLLEREGFEVLQTTSGVDAVDLARSSLLDMVFLSIDLSGMDGLEVARCLRAAERHRAERIALFMLVGRGEQYSAQRLRSLIEARVDGCLESPVDDNALFALIQEHQSRHDDEPPFDVATVKDRFSGDHELLQVFVESFLETVPEQLDELQKAIDEDDATRVVFAAHAMRGGLAFLSAGPAARHLLTLELRAELLERRSREAVLAMLKSELDRIGPMLKQVLGTP
jgi:CheY-like chemotaxis protein